MYVSYSFKEISDIERAQLKERFVEELKQLHEIQVILEDALSDLNTPKKIYRQRIKAQKLASTLEDQIKQVELDRRLKVLTLTMRDMKRVRRALKKRIVNKVDPTKRLLEVAFLEEKMVDEIFRKECGFTDSKGVIVSESEMDILLETVAS